MASSSTASINALVPVYGAVRDSPPPIPISDDRSSVFTPPALLESKLESPTNTLSRRPRRALPCPCIHCPTRPAVLLANFERLRHARGVCVAARSGQQSAAAQTASYGSWRPRA